MQRNIFTRNPGGTRLPGILVRRDRVQAVLHHIQEIQKHREFPGGFLLPPRKHHYCAPYDDTTASFYALPTLLFEGHSTIRHYID